MINKSSQEFLRTINMTEINPVYIMNEGFVIEIDRIKQEVKQIIQNGGFLGFIRIYPREEKPRDFYSSFSVEDIYREIGKLDARRITPFAKSNQNYLTSLVHTYEQLLPLIPDPQAKTYVEIVINSVKDKIKELTDIVECLELDNLIKKEQ